MLIWINQLYWLSLRCKFRKTLFSAYENDNEDQYEDDNENEDEKR